MAAPHSGAPSTSDGDGAESSEPRAVSLDDLFGDPRPGGAADDGGATVDDGGTTTADGGAGEAADVEPGSWADRASSDTAPHLVTFDELSADPTDLAEPGTGPRVATFEEPAGDRDLPEGIEPARAVSFDELSGRRGRSGTAARGPRRDTGGEVRGVGEGRERRSRGRTAGPGQEPRERGGRRGESRGSSGPEPERTPAEYEARAKEICLRLLTDRARTVKELGDALRRKEIPDEIADRVLARFDEVGLIDDKAFADQWVRSRHRYRGLGKRAIALELHRKGVDREIADEALTEIDDESERERARDLVVKRLRSLPIGTRDERQATARKLVGMLARKGYGAGVAYGVVKDEIAAAGADAEELGETPPED